MACRAVYEKKINNKIIFLCFVRLLLDSDFRYLPQSEHLVSRAALIHAKSLPIMDKAVPEQPTHHLPQQFLAVNKNLRARPQTQQDQRPIEQESTDNYPHSDKNTPNSDPHTHYQSGSR